MNNISDAETDADDAASTQQTDERTSESLAMASDSYNICMNYWPWYKYEIDIYNIVHKRLWEIVTGPVGN